jgi:hypothetical protein
VKATITMYGYVREYCLLKPHELPSATDHQLAEGLSWLSNDFRDDPDWQCVAVGKMTIEREPAEAFAAKQVELLRKQQVGVQAAAQAKVTEIERQIQSLLAITHEVRA